VNQRILREITEHPL